MSAGEWEAVPNEQLGMDIYDTAESPRRHLAWFENEDHARACVEARADIARQKAENEALRAEKAAETARADRAEQDLARLRVNAGTRLDEAEAALAAERGHAGKLAAALAPFAEFIAGTHSVWDDNRRIATLNFDFDKLRVGLFRCAARVLAEYRVRSIAADAKPPAWADDRLRPSRIMSGADISAEEEDDVPTDARRGSDV